MRNVNEVRKNSFEERNSDFYDVGHEQLFSELSSEVAALIVGGGQVEFENIQILKSTAKSLCLYVDGEEVWSSSIDGKAVLPVKINDSPLTVGYNGSTFIELFENCEEESKGQKIAKVRIPSAPVFKETMQFKMGDDSIYRLTYRIY